MNIGIDCHTDLRLWSLNAVGTDSIGGVIPKQIEPTHSTFDMNLDLSQINILWQYTMTRWRLTVNI